MFVIWQPVCTIGFTEKHLSYQVFYFPCFMGADGQLRAFTCPRMRGKEQKKNLNSVQAQTHHCLLGGVQTSLDSGLLRGSYVRASFGICSAPSHFVTVNGFRREPANSDFLKIILAPKPLGICSLGNTWKE